MSKHDIARPQAEPAPDRPGLRERGAALAAGLARLKPRKPPEKADAGRRAVMGVALAAAVPLPALTAAALAAPVEPIGPEEAAFLALIPEALPILRRFIVADAAWRAIAAEAGDVAGPCPSPTATREEHAAWSNRKREVRDARGYRAAREIADPLEDALVAIVDGYDDVPMRTLPAILFKVALNDLHEGWGDSAADDLRRLAAERFGLPDPDADDEADADAPTA